MCNPRILFFARIVTMLISIYYIRLVLGVHHNSIPVFIFAVDKRQDQRFCLVKCFLQILQCEI